MWEVMEAFLKEVPLIKHQLDSYNDFVNFRIQEIIENSEPIKLSEGDIEIRFHRCRLEQPKFIEADGSKRSIYPFEARLRRIT
ncbi:MAG: DNA-directed RNA polymerase subunit B'', partial [archaeon]